MSDRISLDKLKQFFIRGKCEKICDFFLFNVYIIKLFLFVEISNYIFEYFNEYENNVYTVQEQSFNHLFKLSLQNMTISGYRRGFKSN